MQGIELVLVLRLVNADALGTFQQNCQASEGGRRFRRSGGDPAVGLRDRALLFDGAPQSPELLGMGIVVAVVRSNQVWALDATYIPMARGFVYLTAVVDVASRRVLAHKVAITLEACHAREVIDAAFARYGTPEIVNADQGSQFTAETFTEAVLAQGCKLSMDGRGAWPDNVFAERVGRSVKCERVHLKAYDSVSAARADIADYEGVSLPC